MAAYAVSACMQDTFARARNPAASCIQGTLSSRDRHGGCEQIYIAYKAAMSSVQATIGYIVYNP